MGGQPAPALTAGAIAFLVGFPRSGTTLVDTFLLGHPQCLVLEELPLLSNAAEALGPIEDLPSVDAERLAAVRDLYFGQIEALTRGREAKLVVDKFPLNLIAAPVIHCLFPGAPIIFVKRHPCDAVLSGFMQSFEPNVGMASFSTCRTPPSSTIE